MRFSRTNTDQTVVANSGTDVHEADLIILKDWANQYPAKEGARVAGMTPNGFKKVQAGEAALSFEKLMTAMRRDPELLAMIVNRCGGDFGMTPRKFAAISQAINSIMRGDFSE